MKEIIQLNRFIEWYFGIERDFFWTFTAQWIKENGYDFYYGDMAVNLYPITTIEKFVGFITALYFLGEEYCKCGEFSLQELPHNEIGMEIACRVICDNGKTLTFTLPLLERHDVLQFHNINKQT